MAHSHQVPPSAVSISTAYQLFRLFSDIVAFEEKCCHCALSGGPPERTHVNFLNLYLLEVDLHHQNHNNPQLWQVAQHAGQYMTGWTELNVILDNNTSCTLLEHIGHWWQPGHCPLITLCIKDLCSYGSGTDVGYFSSKQFPS
ncbi:hypothetical protein C8Q78DRAFT_1075113 [Trametes maxima]|nr:hypothetical protein C8Q78DRAFT_1075113 [Trametes maxima]